MLELIYLELVVNLDVQHVGVGCGCQFDSDGAVCKRRFLVFCIGTQATINCSYRLIQRDLIVDEELVDFVDQYHRARRQANVAVQTKVDDALDHNVGFLCCHLDLSMSKSFRRLSLKDTTNLCSRV